MDDRDLEARLATHLHRRFDGAPPPPTLAASVERLIAAPARPIGRSTLRIRSFSLGWASIAVAVVVALTAIAGLRFGGFLGPGAPTPTSPPATSAASNERWFLVMPPTAIIPSKADGSFASDVLAARIRALDIGTFTSGTGYGIHFELVDVPADAPTNEQIRSVLGANGDIEFVPLPRADYDDAGVTAVVGKPLPKDEPALFGWDGIASASRNTNDQSGEPTLMITLKAAAASGFGDYTAAHIGETFAIVIDGRVALMPIVTEGIPGGQIEIASGGDDNGAFELALAVAVGGRLPESWRDPVVPVVRSRELIVTELLARTPGATSSESASLEAIRADGDWRAIWRVVLDGQFSECGGPPAPGNTVTCLEATSREFVVDAETGEVISSGPPS